MARIKTRLRAKIHVYDALTVLLEDAIRMPGEWLDTNAEGKSINVDEAALVREVATELLTEIEGRLQRAKAKIKPKSVSP